VVISAAWLEIFGGFAPHPSPLPLEREPICVGFESEYNAVFQAGAPRPNSTISSLSLWERARVRGS